MAYEIWFHRFLACIWSLSFFSLLSYKLLTHYWHLYHMMTHSPISIWKSNAKCVAAFSDLWKTVIGVMKLDLICLDLAFCIFKGHFSRKSVLSCPSRWRFPDKGWNESTFFTENDTVKTSGNVGSLSPKENADKNRTLHNRPRDILETCFISIDFSK